MCVCIYIYIHICIYIYIYICIYKVYTYSYGRPVSKDTVGVHNLNVEIAKHSFVPDLKHLSQRNT